MVDVSRPAAGSTPARAATREHRHSGRTVRATAHEKVAQRRAGTARSARAGPPTVRRAKRSVEQYVREQPLKSVLIAAGVGLVLGRFWMRR